MKVSLHQFCDYCTKNNLPFACYRLPGGKSIKVVVQKTAELKRVEPGKALAYQKGFLFAPFIEDKVFKKVVIVADIFTTEEKLPALNFAATPVKNIYEQKIKLKGAGENNYKKYVKKIIRQIAKGRFKKVVAARVSKHTKPKNFNAAGFFKKLCRKYPTAFASLVYTPQYGLWTGASPEILLNVNSNGFETYALAGTQNAEKLKASKTSTDAKWGDKEKEEQQIVSDYIINAFKNVSKQAPVITGPETVKAGNLLHLRTSFVFATVSHSQWPEVVEQLHPTPAVAGLPKQEAIAFILKNEKAPRGFYSGYLGPLNLDNQINLYVNLRCMKVLKHKLALFVGCGVTTDSQPDAEWLESVMKTNTLLSVLTKNDKEE